MKIKITDDKKEKDNSFEASFSLEATSSGGQARLEMFTFGDKDEESATKNALLILENFANSLNEKLKEAKNK